MNNSYDNIDDLAASLKAVSPGSLIGLEGFTLSGKTYLADALGKVVPMCVFHTDDYTTKFDELPPYPECVDIRRLLSALETRDVSRAAIIEGICLRDVLARINITPALYVYVKRISEQGLWHDGFCLESFEACDNHDLHEIHLSDFRYHQRLRPHEQADIIFNRIEVAPKEAFY